MPDHMLTQDYERKLEEISMKLFESTKPKKHRSNIRTSYRTDFSKPVLNFNDYGNFFGNYQEQLMLNLTTLTESLKIVENPIKQYPITKKSKKSVRFADTIGCAMLNVVEFSPYPNEDEDKTIDSDDSWSSDSSFDSLELDTFEVENIRSKWKCCFEQPGLLPNFYQELKEKKILLEFVHVNHNILDGTIRVINLSKFKRVSIRVTFNEWKSYTDVPGEYGKSLNFEHVLTDQFKFSVKLDDDMISKLLEENKYISSTNEPIFRCQFAICLDTFSDNELQNKQESHWDNNQSKNYCFESYLQMIY